MPVDATTLLLAIAISFVAVILQGVVGTGYGMLSVPLLTLLDPALTPVPQLLIAIPLTVAVLLRERHAVEGKAIGWIIVGRVPGAFIGLALLTRADPKLLQIMIAGAVLFGVAVGLSGYSLQRGPASSMIAGTLSGIASLVASVGGAPVALLFQDDSGPAVRANLAAVFTFGITLTVVARLAAGEISGDDVRVAVALLPALLAGFMVSSRIRHRFEGPAVKRGILTVAGLAALALLVRNLVG